MVPSTFASVPSPNSNQRRCSRALSPVPTEEKYRSAPLKLISTRAFSSTGSPPRRRKVRELRFRLWGEKLRSLPCARRKSPWGTPPLPTEPSSAAVSSFAALRMRHTPCGCYAGLWRGPNWGAQQHRRKSSWGAHRWKLATAMHRAMDHRPYHNNPLSCGHPPFRGNLWGALLASPVRGGGSA